MKKTSRTLQLVQTWFLAAILSVAFPAVPASANAAQHSALQRDPAAASVVPPAAWYDEILNSRAKTIQVVFVIVLIGAFVLRRAS